MAQIPNGANLPIFSSLKFKSKKTEDLTKFNNIEVELEDLEKKALLNIVLNLIFLAFFINYEKSNAREHFDNMRVMAVNSDISTEVFLQIIKSCGEICFKSQHFSMMVMDDDEGKQIFYSTIKFFDVLSDFFHIYY
jgi:hypothetical protein